LTPHGPPFIIIHYHHNLDWLEPKQIGLFCRKDAQNSQKGKLKNHMLFMRFLSLFSANLFVQELFHHSAIIQGRA
jgi:hypothetical protein